MFWRRHNKEAIEIERRLNVLENQLTSHCNSCHSHINTAQLISAQLVALNGRFRDLEEQLDKLESLVEHDARIGPHS